MTHTARTMQWRHRLVPVSFALALGSLSLAAQSVHPGASQMSYPERSAEAVTAPSQADAPIEGDRLLSAFHDRASLRRVEALEEADASPALDAAAATALLHEALHDRDPLVREASLRALLRRDTIENPVLTEQEARPFKGREAELAALHFAVKRGDHGALRELIRSGDAAVQESAFESLAAYDTASAVEVLQEELRDSRSLSRLQTLQLLGRSSYTNSWDTLSPTLLELSEDADPLVRDCALQLRQEHAGGAEEEALRSR